MDCARRHHAAPMGLKTVLVGLVYYKHVAPMELAVAAHRRCSDTPNAFNVERTRNRAVAWSSRVGRHNDMTLAMSSLLRNGELCTSVSNVAFNDCPTAETKTPSTNKGTATTAPSRRPPTKD